MTDRTRSDNFQSDEVVPDCTKLVYSYQTSGSGEETQVIQSCNELMYHYGAQVPLITANNMTDIVTPQFHKLSGEGKIFNNPMTIERSSYFESMARFELKLLRKQYVFEPHEAGTAQGITGNHWNGYMAASYKLGSPASATYCELPELDIDACKSRAITQAHANITFSQARMLETLGEGKETIRGLASIFKRVIKIYKALKRLDLKALKKEISLKQLQDRYMEARYTLRPLIYEASMIHAAYTAPLMKGNRHTFRGYDAVEGSYENLHVLANEGSSYHYWVSHTCQRKVEARAGVLVSVERVTAPMLWGLDQPIETLWELTPFSFIADWFWNIGQTISSFTPTAGTKELASWVVLTDTREYLKWVDDCTMMADPENYNHGCSIIFTDSKIGATIKTVERIVQPSRSFIPRFKLRLNALKLLDLAIILKSLILSEGGTKYRRT